MRPIPAIALGTLGAIEGGAALQRNSERSETYEAAERHAAAIGRPLLVVGNPHSGAWTSMFPAYGCGDTCVDLEGCPSCPIQLEADVTHPLPLPDDSQVVYVSCVLEYVDDFEAAWEELLRVAGSEENIFVTIVQPWSLTAALYPGAKRTLHQVGRGYEAAPVSGLRKATSFSFLVGLLAWMLWPEAEET